MDNEDRIADLLPFAHRQPKPRVKGLNYVRGPSVLGGVLEDAVASYAPHIDILKLSGHQISFATEASVRRAIDACRAADVRVSVGNPPIDAALSAGRPCLEAVLAKLSAWNVDLVELSVIARALDEDDLAAAIAIASDPGIEVMLEVGVDFAHTRSADHELFLKRRARLAAAGLAAGARYVLIESEGLTENRDGQLHRWEAVDEIVANLDPASVIFEGDDQDVMSRILDIYGPKAGVMVDYTRIEILEAARRGFGPSQFLWGKVATVAAAE